ncbi:MAG: hemerythrin domain-containing protein [Bacteroidetes bacterium]|nr:hemerythrin domain-containing protein [Bacteroidota bacterium]
MSEPIKRNPSLQPLSRDHHHGLLLCWKIRTGFSKGVSTERIKTYADWFYQNYILKHFEIEEKYVFPVLGTANELIGRALEEHENLRKLFTDDNDAEGSLRKLSIDLENHIRFEERILFNDIQKSASPQQLDVIKSSHPDLRFADNLYDQFWV